MAILSKEDFFTAIKTRVGDDVSDDAMKFIEDITDTYNSLTETSEKGDGEDWKTKYEELDKSWREKYKARFFESGNTNSSNESTAEKAKEEQAEDVKDDGENISFDELFEEREG